MAWAKRQSPRLPVSLECKVEGASGVGTMCISDLSPTGCYVDTRTAVAVGSLVTIRMMVAGQLLTLTGCVAHSHPTIGFGMQFDAFSVESSGEIIKRFLDGLHYPPH